MEVKWVPNWLALYAILQKADAVMTANWNALYTILKNTGSVTLENFHTTTP